MSTLPDRPLSIRHYLTAVLIALVLPAGAFGVPPLFAVMLLAIFCGLSVSDRGEHFRRLTLTAGFHPIGILIILMLLAWLPGIISSPTPLESIKTWGRVAFVIVGAALLWSVLDRNSRLQTLTSKTLIGVLTAILSLTVLAIHFYPEIIYWLRHTTNVWGRYKAFASAQACMIPLLLWTIYSTRDWRRWCAVLCIGLILHMVVGTGSRSALAGLALSMLVGACLLAIRFPRLRFFMGLGILGGGALIGFYLRGYLTNVGTGDNPLGVPLWLIDYHRQHIWSFVAGTIPDAPLFGHGLNAIAHIPGADALVPGLTVAVVPSHPHNWILEILSETGVFGFSAVALIIANFMIHDLCAVLKRQDMRALTRLTMFVAFWGSSCFNFSIWAPWWGVTFLLLTAILSARPEVPSEPKAKMLFGVTEGFAFLSHRLPMAHAAQSCGYDVGVICKPGDKTEDIRTHGIGVHNWNINRSGTNPFREFLTLNALRKSYGQQQPALVHHVAVKPVLYGAIAACIANVPMVVNAMIGLGFLFINKGQKATILRKLVLFLLRLTLNRPGSVLLVQNPDDADLFANAGVVSKDRIVLIPGSGVDADHYTPLPEPTEGPIVISVVSRMLWDKGIGETVEAARTLKDRGLDVEIRLIGGSDPANPQNIPEATLQSWHDEGVIVWNGPRSDIKTVWSESHIALLPSYREGMPKALLEAAACARPLITTEAPGCRSLVAHEQNGLLVPLKDAAAIAEAITRLVQNPDERLSMGADARRRIETIYSETIVSRDVATLYASLANPNQQAGAA